MAERWRLAAHPTKALLPGMRLTNSSPSRTRREKNSVAAAWKCLSTVAAATAAVPRGDPCSASAVAA